MKIPHLILFVFLAFPGITLAAAAPPATVPGFTFVKTVGSISEYRLESNGLQVLLLPEHSSPTLTFMVTYRVGSRNEVTGTTGATHLLEHLMFKGTPEFNREKGTSVDQLLERVGGIYNATTWLDRTNYYANIGEREPRQIHGDRGRPHAQSLAARGRSEAGDDGGAE